MDTLAGFVKIILFQ